MAGIIGFVIGWAITLFILCIKDGIWWRKDSEGLKKWQLILDRYSPTEFSCGNIRWTGYQLEIRGKIRGNEYESQSQR